MLMMLERKIRGNCCMKKRKAPFQITCFLSEIESFLSLIELLIMFNYLVESLPIQYSIGISTKLMSKMARYRVVEPKFLSKIFVAKPFSLK
jgi:hypothetical protein